LNTFYCHLTHLRKVPHFRNYYFFGEIPFPFPFLISYFVLFCFIYCVDLILILIFSYCIYISSKNTFKEAVIDFWIWELRGDSCGRHYYFNCNGFIVVLWYKFTLTLKAVRKLPLTVYTMCFGQDFSKGEVRWMFSYLTFLAIVW